MTDIADQYINWLKSEINVAKLSSSGAVEITTPFLDRHNDKLQIYATRQNGRLFLTDAGEVLSDLESCGVDLRSGKRAELLQTTLNGFGIQEKGGELTVEVDGDNGSDVGIKMNNLIQAMLGINDLFYTSKEQTASFFFEDVRNWFDANEIRYSENIQLSGLSTLSYHFDFLIPKSKIAPERAIRLINVLNKNAAQQIMWSWLDTRKIRPANSELYVLVNSEKPIQNQLSKSFEAYEIKSCLWKERGRVRQQLAA